MPRSASRRPGPSPGQVVVVSPLLLRLLLLAWCAGACGGSPIFPQGLQPAEELQLWNEIYDACSSFLSVDSQTQASAALKEFCFMLMGILPKPRSSVVHPLLQLVPQLHERRMKRFKVDEEFQSPFASRSKGYFLFRPRNGRRSAGFI
uniref:Neuromedin U n=1 Tax=Sciurus vulgaris TaxID=55149 RepID=A0A8D2JQ91_SCIVU